MYAADLHGHTRRLTDTPALPPPIGGRTKNLTSPGSLAGAWSPDGRLLVYASSRGGLFVMNLQTHKEFRIYKGGAKNPSWGPPPADFK